MAEFWSTSEQKIPDHVPADLVRHIDLWNRPASGECPYAQVARVQAENPDIFYNTFDPQCGASWVLTREDDLRKVMEDPAGFSSDGVAAASALVGETWKAIPLETDPPAHRHYRAILNKFLLPSAVAKMEVGVRERAIALIDGFKNDGGCEFNSAFGIPFPVGVFLDLMGLPAEDRDMLVGINNQLNHDTPIEAKVGACAALRDYLIVVREDRKKNPRDDLATFIVQSEINSAPLTDDEILGLYFTATIAGLDTVASVSGQMFKYLAESPEQQARLVAAPEIAPQAIEEMLRAFSPVMTRRKATEDTRISGVHIRKGDWVTIITAFAGLDPKRYPDPTKVDFGRTNNRHIGFATGPHACAGVHLARRELQIALTEWFKRIPSFRIAPDTVPVMKNGGVIGPVELKLVWP
jgi:cytochrome P450